MKWFRLHSEFATDPKLKTFTKTQRYDLICLLCIANESKERGVINLDPEDIAATLDQDEAEYAAFIAKLSKKGILSQREDGAIVFTNWLTRQYDKLSDTPKESAARQQKRRVGAADSVTNEDNNKVSRGCHADVTRSHAIYSDTDTDTYSDSDSEDKKREEKKGAEQKKDVPPAPSNQIILRATEPVHAAEAAYAITAVSDTALSTAKKPAPRPKHCPAAFEQVFDSYPEDFRAARAEVVGLWDRMRPSAEDVTAILVFIEEAKQTDRWRGQYIKQLKSFLVSRQWESDLAEYSDRKKINRQGQTASSDIEKMAASMLSRSMPALTGGN